jgi:endonuclease/exonuclease/phosphatase family metal-dependent hydrolase
MPDLRVATLNLFNNPAGRWDDRAGLVAEQAVELDADVLAFQECDLEGPQVRQVVAALGETYELVPLANPSPGSIKSLALATRLPVLTSDACLDLGSDDIALRVRVDAGDRPIDVVTTHLHFGPSRRGSEIRAAQVQRLLAWLGPVGDRPVAVVGDFNGGAGGATVAAMKAVLRSAHEAVHGDEPPWTHPTPLVEAVDTEAAFGVPILPEGDGHAIDYVFVSPPVEVRDCRVAFDRPAPHEPRLYPSDHLGLVADLVVR